MFQLEPTLFLNINLFSCNEMKLCLFGDKMDEYLEKYEESSFFFI